jgi:hypothetical protein
MADTPTAARPPTDELTLGRLVAHGPAPHKFRPHAEPSYYVKLETDRGVREFWSPGIQGAFETATSKLTIGDQIGVRQNSIDPISVVTHKRDTNGRSIEERRFDTPRTQWVIEKREWFDERAAAAARLRDPRAHPREAVKDHRELLPAYLILDSAKKVAELRYEKQKHREGSVAFVREALAHAIERGEPLPQLKLRERVKTQTPTLTGPASPEREPPTR